jgi:hypothetical protein
MLLPMILDIMLHAVSQVVRTILQLQSHAPDSSEYPTRKLHTNKREKERKSTTHMQRGPPVAVTMKRERESARPRILPRYQLGLPTTGYRGPQPCGAHGSCTIDSAVGRDLILFFMMEGSYSYRNPV